MAKGAVNIDCILDAKAEVGEGPAWDASTGSLLWVDILRCEVHQYDPVASSDRVIRLPDYVGAVVPRRRGGMVVAMRGGFHYLNPETESIELLAEVETDQPTHRFNDGKCDPSGRFWAGTMELNENRPNGVLYCLEPDLRVRATVHGVTISNGLGWSPDQRTMYYIDTPTKVVSAFDYDPATGALTRRRSVLRIEHGFPDGMAVDSEGMVWVAHWGGYRISRWNPDSGTLLEEFPVPTAQVSSLAFGGPDWRQIYITTAARGLSTAQREQEPLAGGIFTMQSPVPGLPTQEFAG